MERNDELDAAAWKCLVESPRFQQMTVAEAVAEMRMNGIARDKDEEQI